MTKATNKVKTEEAAPAVDPVVEMMAKMQAEMEKLREGQTQAVAVAVAAAVAAAKPEEPLSVTEMAKREEQHNKVLRDLVDAQKTAMMDCFGYNEDALDRIAPEFRDGTDEAKHKGMTHYREVVLQIMWAIAASCSRQYMYSRYRADIEYLRLSKISERLGFINRRETDGIQPTTEFNPNRDYERAEESFDYYTSNMLPYEVLRHAAYETWAEICEEKRAEHYESGVDTPFREPNEPQCDISEGAYILYVDNMASKREAQAISDGADALTAARLLRMTRMSQSQSEEK